MEKKTRIETGYRGVSSENGTFSPHISKKTNDRLSRYCRINNENKTKFVEYCINHTLNSLERAMYEEKSKEELIQILMDLSGCSSNS